MLTSGISPAFRLFSINEKAWNWNGSSEKYCSAKSTCPYIQLQGKNAHALAKPLHIYFGGNLFALVLVVQQQKKTTLINGEALKLKHNKVIAISSIAKCSIMLI